MKISRGWLQTFFAGALPDVQAIADALTFHAFEIESVENEILDVKITPNRGHDCLSHLGIAKEISAILNVPLKPEYYGFTKPIILEPATGEVSVSIDTPLCARYAAGYIRGVKVGQSPDWLKKSLESIGQKSINNIVDAANFVMFNIGQPLHAFDASRLEARSSKLEAKFKIQIRNAKSGEKTTTLDNRELSLSESMLVIADGNADKAIGIAGVKGGKSAEVGGSTTDIILESANFDGVSVRKTAQALKLRTDASTRFEQGISPELAAYGMREAANLIVKIAGGEIVGFADQYPNPQKERKVSVSVAQVNQILGTNLKDGDVVDAFKRLGLPFENNSGKFTVSVPFERLDLGIPEDLVEEIARIVGYDKIPSKELPPLKQNQEINTNFYSAEHAREELLSKGYSEVYTSVFADKGEREVLNKVGGERPFLRSTLIAGLNEALEKNKHNKDLLGLKEIKLFEIGTVWKGGKELAILGTISEKENGKETPLKVSEEKGITQYENLPVSQTTRYQTFSRYPAIVRDIALWCPQGTEPVEVLNIIKSHAGDLLVHSELFDRFEKNGKISLAFRLVFQSFDRTLFDGDANERMESVYSAVKKEGWEVR